VRENMVFQSMLRGSLELREIAPDYPFAEEAIFNRPEYPRLHFVERRYSQDPTNWWIPNRACVEAMLRSAGFGIVAHPETEVYVCRRAEQTAPWPECELEQRNDP
jgi:tRNA (mo5U34)-methyltransferase